MVNNSTNNNKTKESLNSDGQQFHQYQENKQSPLNSDGQQFHQYQENKQSPLISTHWTQKDYGIWRWKSRF